jgi:prepilin-type processing-associated H-X9-DG protein
VVSHEDVDLNFGLGGQPATKTPVPDSQIVNPSDMMAIGDVVHSRPALHCDPAVNYTLFAYHRHQGRFNVVFCDGHVESPMLKYLLIDTSDEALSRWNRDHLPHREMLHP